MIDRRLRRFAKPVPGLMSIGSGGFRAGSQRMGTGGMNRFSKLWIYGLIAIPVFPKVEAFGGLGVPICWMT